MVRLLPRRQSWRNAKLMVIVTFGAGKPKHRQTIMRRTDK
jgi:hypothetical protein